MGTAERITHAHRGVRRGVPENSSFTPGNADSVSLPVRFTAANGQEPLQFSILALQSNPRATFCGAEKLLQLKAWPAQSDVGMISAKAIEPLM